MDVAPQAVGCGEPEERQSRHEPEEAADGHFRLILCAFLALFLTGVLYLMAGRRGRSETLLQSNPLQSLTETPVHLLYTLDENLGKLRQFNDAAFHKFSPVVPFEALGSDVFLVGVMGSGLTLLTQIGHQLRSNGSMSFEDLNEVVPWFHAALLCGQDLDEAQAFPPRLYKTHQRYEKLPEGAKFVVLFRDPEDVLWARYQRYCNSSWTEYARVPKAAITLEDFAAGMFAHKSSNEVWHFMKSWLSCCMGHDRVLYVTYEDLMEQPEREISRIARFILPHRQATDELLRTARLQSTKDFMQEHISKFDDHFVLKHLPVFKQDVKAYGLVPRIPRVMRQTPKELPRAVQELLAARWQSYVGESGFASYRELRTWLRADPLNKQGELNDEVTQGHFWKGVLFLLAAACVIVLVSKELRLRALALFRRSVRGTLVGSRSL